MCVRRICQRLHLEGVVEVARQLKKPQDLTSALSPEKLHTSFAIPTCTSLALRADTRLDLHIVSARLTHPLNDGPIPSITVPPLREYRCAAFQLALVGSWVSRSAHISTDDELSHPVRADPVRDIEEHPVEMFKLLAAGVVGDHSSVLPEDAKIESIVQARRRDEGGLRRGRRQLFEVTSGECFPKRRNSQEPKLEQQRPRPKRIKRVEPYSALSWRNPRCRA